MTSSENPSSTQSKTGPYRDPKPKDKRPLAKRFYKAVSVTERDDGCRVFLDGRELKTPAKRALSLPTRSLAERIAEEWDAQREEINPFEMPMMQLAATALDRLSVERDGVINAIARYGETDLLCYRTDHPADLAARQAEAWQPVLNWAADTLGAPLNVTRGLLPVAQPPESLAALRQAIETEDNFRLSALSAATASAGSVIVGLALIHGRLDASQAYEVAQLDESYQIEIWGEDSEARARQQALRAELAHAERFINLLTD